MTRIRPSLGPALAMAGCSSGGSPPAPGPSWQERQILAEWAAVVPHPRFDYAYSWGPQKDDTSLSQSPALQAVFAAKNK